MIRKATLVFVLIVILAFGFGETAQAATYSGSLQYTPPTPPDSLDGLFVGPSDLQWVTYTNTISWVVTDTDNSYSGFPWKYTYTFGHDGGQAGISHIIIEASDGITANDITGLTGASITSIGPQTVLSGNPNMPEDLNGLRFNPLTTSPFSMTWTFWSNKAPVWGDMYARCGGKQGGINFAHNMGFTDTDGIDSIMDDIDPSALPSNGSIDNHILRPDSTVPEPSGLMGLALGIGSLGAYLLRKR